jgi:beta-phosphoglucomutase-like phosphatase (HAD superfamily)
VTADYSSVTTLLCDADGNLFPSEEPAYEVSVDVTNAFLSAHGIGERVDPVVLRRTSTGKNFRSTVLDICERHAIVIDGDELEQWVDQERVRVTRHLIATLRPDPDVLGPLSSLSQNYALAAVSSSALSRLAGCFSVTGLDRLLPSDHWFSAEDSLLIPTSKPDPAVYRHACAALDLDPAAALAVEDAAPGVASAVAAGVPTVGNIQFVPPDERDGREQELSEAGAVAVVRSWGELHALLSASCFTSASS